MSQQATQEIVLPITGMTCTGCTDAVRRILLAVPGVRAASVSLETRSATVDCDPARASREAIARALDQGGFGLGS